MTAALRELLEAPSQEVAPRLLGAVVSHTTAQGTVAVRLTEVEAYEGDGEDPGSHAYRGRTARNAVMYGAAGTLYTYFTYGMHTCANVTCSPPGRASAVLLRAGEVVAGSSLARSRRTTARRDADLARGPARLVVALGIALADGGTDLLAPPFGLALPEAPVARVATGPRVGVSGAGGDGERFPWRFWIPDDPTVSAYRPGRPPRARAPR
ncbi:DNA-3-methyladenine glycosylase [Amnibacterium kyonggiense]|uniref:Putative 3-methyladenine DNA glycosylase n=1 Tax=Amnibacterium kyonggiense TaxID=595671 RepID=A0A4R7FHF0_9MICO|nr:DNA-3-methyladenine glycosylase [Amnibacterium kyonggiense]TDS75564.1 DNA-3-methyladenine glycosylase [Amnibacterium kyonggiense]